MTLVEQAARAHKLPERLIEAMVQVESGGEPAAMRVETHYRWLWDVQRGRSMQPDNPGRVPDGFPSIGTASAATEFWGQKTSWGLLQIMGATAREYGFRGAFLTELCTDPREGLEFACRYLSSLRLRYEAEYGMEGAVAAYNAGSVVRTNGRYRNQEYVEKVRKAGGL